MGPFRDSRHIAEERALDELARRRSEELELASFRKRLRELEHGPRFGVNWLTAGIAGLSAVLLLTWLGVTTAPTQTPPLELSRAPSTPPLHLELGELPTLPLSTRPSVCMLPAGLGPIDGALKPEQVRRVIMAHTGALRACYEVVAQSQPSLRGGVNVAFDVAPSGVVSSASISRTTLNDARVEGCVVRQLKTWHFPASDSPTSIGGYPFRFGVGG